MREQRHWEDFPQRLAQALPEAVIVTPDLPGNGQRHGLRSASRIGDSVEFCRDQLRARDLLPPYRLLALSLGGMVAVEWASRYPAEIAGAVLINTSMRPYGRFHQRLRWRNYAALAGLLLRGGAGGHDGQARQERLILELSSNDDATRAALLPRWLAYQRDYPVTRGNALRQLWSAARYRAPAARPPVPLLILSAAGDRLVDPECSRRLAQAWQLDHRQHPSAGHDLPLDDGPWVAHMVAQAAAHWPATKPA
ncbi:alpha/beta fold hydrolase [Rugamonas sp.]|uniref:alpha/beta fold hydrolase n=1 Tax=Rugamonas sp. TaxID=1926287 RepID=UPI0025F70362|nr:alpha/beta fold hydrolase [Rugamonas sp.]